MILPREPFQDAAQHLNGLYGVIQTDRVCANPYAPYGYGKLPFNAFSTPSYPLGLKGRLQEYTG